jgi:hypothetical protein
MENFDDNDGRIMIGNNKQSIKEKISNFLFDREFPEMITYLNDSEINRISAIEEIIRDENILRDNLNINKHNIFFNYLKSLKTHRTSRLGWRSEQAVKIIQSNLESDEMQQRGKFGMFGGMQK